MNDRELVNHALDRIAKARAEQEVNRFWNENPEAARAECEAIDTEMAPDLFDLLRQAEEG